MFAKIANCYEILKDPD